MPAPATTGRLCTTKEEMDIGDYIKIGSINNSSWNFNTGTDELPLMGIPYANSFANYYFYMIKVSTGILVSDRVTQHTASWEIFNSNKVIQGLPWNGGIIRSLTGGVAYADANGNPTASKLDFGAWPINNEWDKYIVNFPANKIQDGKTFIDIFNTSSACPRTWMQDTPINGMGANTYRTVRRGAEFGWLLSSFSNSDTGHQPVFEYAEV